MSNKDDLQKEFQQISANIQRFDEYGKQLQVEIETLQSFLIDLTRSKQTLEGLKEEKKPEETLLQLGSGVMIRAKPIEPNKVYLNVGAGVIVSKTLNEAIEDITNRIDVAEERRLGLDDQLNQVINQINVLEQRAQAIYRQLQGPSKPQYDPDLVS
ncbi:MAG: prefoldin subunit alpha [Asgard group archaeon]|nr:prefoldin subunit alpha [Asgard group archaeon]